MSWFKRKKLFKANVPDLSEYIGRTVKIDGKKIVIKKIVGNVGLTLGRKANETRPTFYEINGEHLIGMLRFHAQMTNDHSISEQEFLEFENMEFFAERINKEKVQ